MIDVLSLSRVRARARVHREKHFQEAREVSWFDFIGARSPPAACTRGTYEFPHCCAPHTRVTCRVGAGAYQTEFDSLVAEERAVMRIGAPSAYACHWLACRFLYIFVYHVPR